jgi:hypothetical protein
MFTARLFRLVYASLLALGKGAEGRIQIVHRRAKVSVSPRILIP